MCNLLDNSDGKCDGFVSGMNNYKIYVSYSYSGWLWIYNNNKMNIYTSITFTKTLHPQRSYKVLIISPCNFINKSIKCSHMQIIEIILANWSRFQMIMLLSGICN